MRARVFTTLTEAVAARRAIDAAAGLPIVHSETDYVVAELGNAAIRIRARGVTTQHAVEIIPGHGESQFAVPSENAQGIEINCETWRGSGLDVEEPWVRHEEQER